jgi:hypothetical protein
MVAKRRPLPAWLSPDRDLSNASYALKCSYAYHTKIYWATPPWLNAEQLAAMAEIYEKARRGQHVDHIVPLKHPRVCGLNVPWNLEIVPAEVNLAKSNHTWPGDANATLELFPFELEPYQYALPV